MKILLVDDDDLVRDMAQRMLALMEHEVTAAHDATTALGLLQDAGPFDVLLTDIVMPGMNGVELAQTVIRARPAMRIVFVSAYSHVDVHTADLDEHGFTLLQKPFRRASLTAALG